MVRAIVAGAKTCTRRVVTLPRWADVHEEIEEDSDGALLAIARRTGCLAQIACPYGVPGDLLWVRETWQTCTTPEDRDPSQVVYAADHNGRPGFVEDEWSWRTPIYMPRWASRLTLCVTAVEAQRLHDITDADAASEGIRAWTKDGALSKYAPADAEGDGPTWPWVDCPRTPRDAFARLWCEINGAGSWEDNPWVWAVRFERAARKAGG